MLKITKLTVNHFKHPMGIGANPSFGWIMESDQRNMKQAAFRLQLSDEASFQKVLFDSGKVLSDCSAHYRPEGLPLQSATKYFWRVTVWTDTDSMYESGPASFVTAILNEKDWVARFITAETEADAGSSKGTFVKSTFTVQGKVRSAYAFSTALGLYHLYVNDVKAGEDHLAPGWTSYHHHLMYQANEITHLINEGENTLCGWLGAGWYKGLMGFLNTRNNYGGRTALLCQIEITYEDGRLQRLVTDESWQGSDSPVLFSEIYDGETYDARYHPEKTQPVHLLPYDLKNLEPQGGCRVRIIDTLRVKKIITTPKGETVLDFGQNLTGWVHFTVSGKPGDVAELRCFEVLDKDGNVYTENLRSAKQTLRYILKGQGEEAYQPLFTYQGFRYVHIVSYPGSIKKESFTACVVHSDMAHTGTFECSHPLVNQLQHNILWGLKGNFLDVPTDCPQRDERLGWTGDAQIFCPTACYLMDTHPFFTKWLKDLQYDQTPEGGVPHVIPDIITNAKATEENWLQSNGTHSATAWADAAVIVPWNVYLASGDAQVLKDQYESMKAWIDFMRSHANGPLWEYRLQFGDWVALDAEEGSCFGATPNEYTCSAYYAYSTGLFAKIAATLGMKEDAKFYGKLHDEICQGFARTFFTKDGELTVSTQTAHVLALQFGLTPPEWVEKTAQALIRLIEKNSGHLVTGFVGTPYIANALSQSGHLKEAYDLVLREEFPSWLFQVKMGATTIWEHWDGIKPDGSMWSAGMNSFNHYAYGAIGDWLYRTIAGIRLDESNSGYRHTWIQPQIGGGLAYAKAAYQSMYGEVAVHWQKDDHQVTLHVHIPCNTTATICLGKAKVVSDDGLQFADGPDGAFASTGSGEYTIIYNLH